MRHDMNIAHTPGTLKRFGRTAWTFQQTFATPPRDIRRFATKIVTSLEPLLGGSVTIESVIFDPKHLTALLAPDRLPAHALTDVTLTAAGRDETARLLEAALSDWIDFLFVPQPKPVVAYADHDEFITFFAQRKSNLHRVTEPLRRAGFEPIDYPRQR
jgi:hypothetical protein